MSNKIKIIKGESALNQKQKQQAAEIFYDGFREKFEKLIIKPESERQGIKIIKNSIDFENGIYALYGEDIVGVLGLNYHSKRYINYKWTELREEFDMRKAVYVFVIDTIANYHNLSDTDIRVEKVVVDSKYRGMGIGKMLFQYLFRYAEERGFKNVKLEVIDVNQVAHNLYKSLGFIDIEEIDFSELGKAAGFTSVFNMIKKL